MTKKTPLRAAGYCRTSGEGQRDNTSIPTQRQSIETYCKGESWPLVEYYVDECKTGSKIEGRDQFQQMMRDVALGLFDVIVVYDITRFARNGADIIDKARFLKETFGIFLVDTKGQFDNRKASNALVNHMFAGISEHERLSIMGRTIGGRIARAKAGKPWGGCPPFGRAYDKATGTWYVTEAGHQIERMLERYADGELLGHLYKEYGFNSAAAAMRPVREAQLSGTFIARFNSPEIDIANLEVPVAAMPEVITPELAARVQQRCEHNRTNNKQVLKKYRLTGFIRCGTCGAALTSCTVNGNQYYRHKSGAGKQCRYRSISARLIEEQALGYLYGFYTDEPAFDDAVRQAMPTTEQRDAVAAELGRARVTLAKVERSIANLIHAIEEGADASMFIDRQKELRDERDILIDKVESLDEELATMPSAELVKQRAQVIKILLMQTHTGKDWRNQEYDEVRQFLGFLFGDNPRRNGCGISVSRVSGGWRVKFKGRVEFAHRLQNGRPTTAAYRRAARAANNLIRTEFELAVEEADRDYAAATGDVQPNKGNIGLIGLMGPMRNMAPYAS